MPQFGEDSKLGRDITYQKNKIFVSLTPVQLSLAALQRTSLKK